MRNKIRLAAFAAAALMLTGCAGTQNSEISSSAASTESTTVTTESTTAATESTTAATESTTATAESTTAATESTTATTESTTAATESTTAATESTTAATESTTAATESTTVTTESTTTAESTTAATTPEESVPEEEEMQEEKLIALTFDDGPNTTTTMEVLDKLEKYGITGTFFLVGNNINEESAKSVKRAYDMGCEIENHSKTHSYMNRMTAEEVLDEYNYVDEYVVEITGEHTKFFRPPYIAVSDAMHDALEAPFISGYGANDWDDRIPAERRANMVLKQAKDGAIILLHDAEGNSLTVEALDIIIPELLAQNYRFVRLDELFELSGVTPKDKYIYSWVYQTGAWG
ncbi:MAG: polysaccharide deacetylase family protein [Oscillospiraceae bacterium]